MLSTVVLVFVLGAQPTPIVNPFTGDPVEITADDVYEQEQANDRQKLERSIRRDIERSDNWSDDYDSDDDDSGY